MARKYSRRQQVQNTRHGRNAFFLIIFTVLLITGVIFYGIPALVNFSAFLADLQGSNSVATQTDTRAPTQPTIYTLPDYTNQKTLNISGYSEGGSIIKVKHNSKTDEVVSDADGDFLYKAYLKEGVNTFSFLSTDSSGNESPRTKTFKVEFDNTPPDLQITEPSEGQSFYGDAQNTIEVKGTTEPEIRLYVGGKLASSDSEGVFSKRITLNDGENSIVVKAIDMAQNETEATIKVNYSP